MKKILALLPSEPSLWFQAHLSLTQVLPLCYVSGIFWCENIAPCWFHFVHYLKTLTSKELSDRRHVGLGGGGGHTNAAKRSILSLTPFFHSFLCSLVTKLVSSSSELPLLEQARQVLSMMPIFLWTLQTKNEVKSQDCKCFSNFPNKYL